MKNTCIIIVLLLTCSFSLQAQQDAQYTQYMYNTISVNPAYAGSRGVLSLTALHRSQWIGLDGAPVTQSLNVHAPTGNRVGIGLSIINDEIGNGTSQETSFGAHFSYTLPTSETGKLSFGIRAGGHLLNLDFNKLRNYNNEAAGLFNIDKKLSPNFGAGIYYHTNTFYAGISVPSFLETEHFDNSSASFLSRERLNLYLITGVVMDLNNNLKFKPSILAKAVQGAPLQLDFSANFLFNEKFMLGTAYRWGAALSALAGFQVSNNIMIGIAYDREITDLGGTAFNDGSFEIILRYEFFKRYGKVVTPRFF